MNTGAVEREVQRTAAGWAFVQRVETVDQTDDAIKLRLHIAPDCLVQVYINTRKQITSYAVVFNRARILGVTAMADPGIGTRRQRQISMTSHPKASAPCHWTNS